MSNMICFLKRTNFFPKFLRKQLFQYKSSFSLPNFVRFQTVEDQILDFVKAIDR